MSFTVDIPGTVHTVNAALRLHWPQNRARTNWWRSQAKQAGTGPVASFLNTNDGPVPCCIVAQPYTPHVPRQDTGACYITVKAVIDGLCDLGLWPDDTPEWVTSILLLPEAHRPDRPETGSGKGILVTVAKDNNETDRSLTANSGIPGR